MRKYIKRKIEPNIITGKYVKLNKTTYEIGQIIGFGEHRFVFELINAKDGCRLFNLLVFRKQDSFKIVQEEALQSNQRHKQMKMYYLKRINCALRERSDVYGMLSDKEQLDNIDKALYELFQNKQYDQIIEVLKKVEKNSYVLILYAYCNRMLGNRKYLKYLKQVKKWDANFDYEKLLQTWEFEHL